jgi:hypothetical protein
MNMQSLALHGDFSLALLPYSLATYLVDADAWQRLAKGLRTALRPSARIIVDAFIPRAGLVGKGWQRDYARWTGKTWLLRHKRIRLLSDGCHLVERRYRMRGAFNGRSLVTAERIRPLQPDQLMTLARRYLGPIECLAWDYGRSSGPTHARFLSVVCRWRGSEAEPHPAHQTHQRG